MQPCSREMQIGLMNNNTSTPQQHQQQQHHHMVEQQSQSSSHDDFLEQMLSTLGPPPPSWPDDDDPNPNFQQHQPGNFDLDSLNLASKFRTHHIASSTKPPSSASAIMLHHQLLMARAAANSGPEPGLLSMPLNDFDPLNDVVDASPFKSPGNNDGPVHGLYNGFGSGSSLPSPNQFHQPQGLVQAQQSYGGPSPAMNQTPAPSGSSGGAQPGQARPRVRARRGQATDPHSIAERLRRERIAERMKALQELVPNANKTDKASMLDEIIDYVKFLQLQVKVLSMSRLGGAGAVAPLVADMSSEGGGDCIQTNTSNGGVHRRSNSNGSANNNNNSQNGSSNDTMTVTEHQVAKLMEEDMGSAMQYLQGKGLCLMPISLATAISTATCHSRNPLLGNANSLMGGADGPTSPSLSALTVQSATAGNGVSDGTVKDAASVSKP